MATPSLVRYAVIAPCLTVALSLYVHGARATESLAVIDQLPGVTQGIGTEFQIEGSDYLDVDIHSTEWVYLYAQSSPQSIFLVIDSTAGASATSITVSHLKPTTAYFLYTDNFHNLTEIQTDGDGTYTTTFDITKPRTVFIQEFKSTKFIADTASGGDCATIGVWEAGTKTCTLTADTAELIQIDSDGITFDGNGHTLLLNPIVLLDRSNVTVKNLQSTASTGAAVTMTQGHNNIIENVTTNKRLSGISLILSTHNVVRHNTVAITNLSTGIALFNASFNIIEQNTIADDVRGVDVFSGEGNTIRHNTVTYEGSEIKPNTIPLWAKGGVRLSRSKGNRVYRNRFIDNAVQAQVLDATGQNFFSAPLPDGGNYWSDFDTPEEGCSDTNRDTFCDDPYHFIGGQDDLPLTGGVAGTHDGASNVLFIPGFQGSRLYREGVAGEDELWVPTTNQDAEQLFLNDDGEAIDPNIYTRDIIDRTKFFFPIYEDFINFMDNEMVAGGIINEWRPLPYDWRFAVDGIAALPTIKQNIEELAASSASGKVTIIAHSNGGLVAKLMLNDPAIAEKVDRLIMVATPQLGTPKTLVALLHGDEQNLGGGFIMRKGTARELGENMPGAYGLLPFAEYFNTVADPVIQFTDEVANNYDFRILYGESIDTFEELFAFLAGDNGARSEPAENDTDAPNVLNVPLLTRARDLHSNLLNNWTAPAGVEVIQIAGWGLDTIYAIEYDDCDFCPFGQDVSNLDREALFTIDGDDVVVEASATEGEDQKYYLNLYEYNKNLRVNVKHKNLVGANPLQNLIKDIIANNLTELPDFISENRPNPSADHGGYRLRMKSPVAVHVYDSASRHTGLIDNPDSQSDLQLYEEEIPNSSYVELGEKKYLSLDNQDTYTIALDGEGVGTFTLEIDELQGDTVIDTVVYENIPVTPTTTGELLLQGLSADPELALDVDGDGHTDVVIQKGATVPPAVSIVILQQSITELDAPHSVTTRLRAWASTVEHFVSQEKTKQARHHSEKLEDSIMQLVDKKKGLSTNQAESLLRIVDQIKKAL